MTDDRIGRVDVHPVLGCFDGARHILANEITAVLDRCEPKDLADIWGFGHARPVIRLRHPFQ